LPPVPAEYFSRAAILAALRIQTAGLGLHFKPVYVLPWTPIVMVAGRQAMLRRGCVTGRSHHITVASLAGCISK
jgi:hypothetical protein